MKIQCPNCGWKASLSSEELTAAIGAATQRQADYHLEHCRQCQWIIRVPVADMQAALPKRKAAQAEEPAKPAKKKPSAKKPAPKKAPSKKAAAKKPAKKPAKKAAAKKPAAKKTPPKPVYVMRKGSDTWHWCKNCSHYPAKGSIEKTRSTKPRNAKLCPQCQSKTKRGMCK